jgi:hypothetical protein
MKRIAVLTLVFGLVILPCFRSAAAPYTPLPFTMTLLNGDVNSDNVVEDQDYSLMGAAWYSTPGSPNWDVRADLNGDGVVEDQDYSIMGMAWYVVGVPPCSGTAVQPGGSYQITGTINLGCWWQGTTQTVQVQAQPQSNQNIYYAMNVNTGQPFTMNVPSGIYTVTAGFTTGSPSPCHWLWGSVSGIDLVPPVQGTSFVAPFTSTAPISVSYNGASDAGSGLKQVELWYKTGSNGIWTDSGLRATGGSGSFSFTPPGNAQGAYYFALAAQDNAGNRSPNPSGNGDCGTVYEACVGSCQFSSMFSP